MPKQRSYLPAENELIFFNTGNTTVCILPTEDCCLVATAVGAFGSQRGTLRVAPHSLPRALEGVHWQKTSRFSLGDRNAILRAAVRDLVAGRTSPPWAKKFGGPARQR